MTALSRAMARTDLPVRRLTHSDLPACMELADDRGWPPEENKWRMMFAVSEIYGVDDLAGGLAGTVVLTRYGLGLAAIGMMVVASRRGRQGLGRLLMRHVLGLADGAVVFLTATGDGRPLYERLGFRPIGTSTTYSGMFTCVPAADAADADAADAAAGTRAAGPDAGLANGRIRPVTAAGLGPLAIVDLAVFGADRGQVLAELVTFADRFVECGEPLSGYAAAWQNGETRVIGPVVAADLTMAADLISSLSAGWTGRVRIDVGGQDLGLARWARAHGLAAGDQTTLMVLGGTLPGDRARLFTPVSVAIG